MTQHNRKKPKEIMRALSRLSDGFDATAPSLAIILAAGHGKRIKSETSKMLHELWGKPTVVRVSNAAQAGLHSANQIVVVGIKALDVAEALGTMPHLQFVFQMQQKGTGDAVRTALQQVPDGYDGAVYIFPGDMGLLSEEVVEKFKEDFEKDTCDMMVLTGLYEGNPINNYYGRILRVPEKDVDGRSSEENTGKVIEIKEHKDILALEGDTAKYSVEYKSRMYAFSKRELIEIREFNTGVYVFQADKLNAYINKLNTDNVQGELYLTDLIRIFNLNGLSVKASAAKDNHTVLGFNVKSVLKEMENYARESVYELLKDIIMIQDKDDFFIADEVVKSILELDKKEGPLDIEIGKDVFIDKNVKLSKGVKIFNHAHITGNVVLDEGVVIQENVFISTFPDQTLRIGKHTEIYHGDNLKGDLQIGENCRVESHVSITGSDDHPTRIGDRVTVKGRTYIYGCDIEDDLWIEHSVLQCKHVEKNLKKDGSVQKIRYVLPIPEGLDSIEELPHGKDV